ncbi:hypothetical protein JXM83_05615 [Candidatus Woesearchaeota archaeon]|nr:hypothetical protein [Candidatus Woesearchaeota archaeon]
MAISREELLKKGWSEEEIDYTFNVIDKAGQNKTGFVHFLDGIISWFGLIIVFIGSLILSVVLMPFLVTLEGFFLYFMIGFMALILGFVFNFLIDQINQVGQQEKILGEILLPVIGLIDVYVMIGIFSVIVTALNIKHVLPNSLLYGIIYVSCFSLPFYIFHFDSLAKKYKNYFQKKPKDVSQSMNISGERGSNVNPSYGQNMVSQDYYQQYLNQVKQQETKKMLYQKRLKDQLLKRLNK